MKEFSKTRIAYSTLRILDHPIEVNERYISELGYTMDDYKNGKIDFAGTYPKEDKRSC